MRTANPALNERTFRDLSAPGSGSMSLQGTVNKTIFLLMIALLTAAYTWHQFSMGNLRLVQILMMVGVFGGFVVALVTIFAKHLSPATSLIYAALEGLFLGGLSAYLESRFPQVVIQAVALTFGTLFVLLMAYKSRLIRVTDNFRLGVVAATGGIMVFYLVTMVLGLFDIRVPFIHESGTVGILFSLFVVGIAALNLVLDFDFIEHGASAKLPRYMEWYAAFGLMVTLVWLYVEILRLLTKLRSR